MQKLLAVGVALPCVCGLFRVLANDKLKLEAEKALMDEVVIDHLERPSED